MIINYNDNNNDNDNIDNDNDNDNNSLISVHPWYGSQPDIKVKQENEKIYIILNMNL